MKKIFKILERIFIITISRFLGYYLFDKYRSNKKKEKRSNKEVISSNNISHGK
ncbi:hypothetical protein KJ671_01060 [Patescibacteria group bacterium]|nr:hypothetical protein [Patescibacteria group bacterium]